MGTKKIRARRHRPSSLTHRVSRHYANRRRVITEEVRRPQVVPELGRGEGWFVLRTAIWAEHRVVAAVRGEGFATFLPVYTRTVTTIAPKGRTEKSTELPLFPRYGFAAFDPDGDAWGAIHDIDGVDGILKNEGKPVSVPTRLLAALAADGSEEEFDATGRRLPKLQLVPGNQVRIVTGPFAGFPAVVSTIGEDAKELISILIDIFGRSTPAQVGIEDLELLAS